MIITIFDKDFVKIGILHKWTYLQYNDKIRDIGEFTLHVQLTDETFFLFDKSKKYYLLFGTKVMGCIQKVEKQADSDYEQTIVVIGKLMSYILERRVVYKTQIYEGNTAEVINDVIYQNITVQQEGMRRVLRYLNMNLLFDENIVESELSSVSFQQTGGYVWDCIKDLFVVDYLGYDLYPNVSELTWGQYGKYTNVYDFDFVVLKGKDRTANNKKGNKPVVFSHSLSNLYRGSYEYDRSEHRNVVYIAGEGEGSNRAWYSFDESGDIAHDKAENYEDFPGLYGWDREELFVDARDLQKETSEKAYTDTEYKNLLKRRAMENMAEHIIFESYDGTVMLDSGKLQYGKDFYKGDWVTIRDNELGMEIDAQITEISKTIQESKEIIDITFGYKKITTRQALRKKGVI